MTSRADIKRRVIGRRVRLDSRSRHFRQDDDVGEVVAVSSRGMTVETKNGRRVYRIRADDIRKWHE